MVRLEKIKDIADKFIRVRLPRIDDVDINLFQFDFDLTFAVFFLTADEKIYARYGQRDLEGPDGLQSLKGLRHTMESVLKMHKSESRSFAPKQREKPLYIRDLSAGGFRARRCLHCHQVKEMEMRHLERTGKWKREMAWRYPLPENLGFDLNVDRGNEIKEIKPKSPLEIAGLKKGDVLTRLHDVPIHSIADATYALDRSPWSGEIVVRWKRGEESKSAKIALPKGWRKSSLAWRASMWQMVPSIPLYGEDLTSEQKNALGLNEKQMAFKQRERVHSRARDAGIQGGDVILGVDGHSLMGRDMIGFLSWVRHNYLSGDKVKIDVLRDGKRMSFPYTLRNR